MAYEIDNDILIALVETRPVLWDKTLDTFKDRNATRDAWRQVCCELNVGFEEMEPKEKNAFGKAVAKRWANLRDAFSKSKRKLEECKKSGRGGPNIKKYVYANQMKFLNKLYQSREGADSLQNSSEINDTGDHNDDEQPEESFLQDIESLSQRKKGIRNDSNTGHRKRHRPDESELNTLKALEQPTLSAHMLFFQGLLPHLNKFDDAEVLEFQMGILELIAKINDKKKNSQPLLPHAHPYYHQNYLFPQPPLFPHPQLSYSNQLNSSNFQALFPQAHHFLNPQLSNYCRNTQQACSSKRKQPETQREQTTAQSYQQCGPSSAVSTPDDYPGDSPSPSASESTDNTYDFS